MIRRLYDKFIKNTGSGPETRENYMRTVFAAAIAVHLLLFAAKITAGSLIRSTSVRADAWSNLAAALSAGFGLAQFVAGEGSENADQGEEKRKKGIRQAGYIAAFIAAFLVFEVGFSLFSRAFSRLRHPTAIVHGIPAVAVLLLCILLRRALAVFFIRTSGEFDLKLLPVYVRSSRAANIRTGFAAAAVILDQYTPVNADFLVTLILSAAVMKEGIMIAVRAIRPAVEEIPDPDLVRAVRARLREYSIIQGTGSIKVRFFGPGRRMIAMRIKVPKAADMAEVFGNVRVIEETVGREFGITLVLHADPIESSDRESLEVRKVLEAELESRDVRLSFDHFHIVRGRDFSNLIFDLFVPGEYGEEKIQALTAELDGKMRLLDTRYICVISPRKLN
ncbi:MAG: hypothetical protein E7240_01810 [Lachnospiraceae bacterium]|nr:hypothetical protein [Lachnospiraceae bacterium]